EASADLQLVEYGRASGAARLPIAARLPLRADREASLSAALDGEVRERGLLSALLPAFAQESHGELSFALGAGGTLGTPDLSGSVHLSRAGAYLPPAGIRLEDVSLSARLEGQRILVESFAAKSGPGRLEGTAELRLEGASVAACRADLRGERFLFANLPELRALATPALQIQGGGDTVSIRGDVAIPELLFRGRPQAATVEESEDVVFVDRWPEEERQRELPFDARVTVTLGKEVRVRARGIDARLEGSIEVVAREEEVQAYGTIRAVEGRYSTYGVSLPIERGRVFFAGPTEAAALDVLAVRQEDEVRAGVTVTGTVERPVVSLYSEPAMPDSDVLAYIVLGHPLGQDREQANLVGRAAGFLLSGSQAMKLQNQLKQRLGIDVLALETRKVPAPAGEEPGAEERVDGERQAALEEAVVRVGKQLTPKLFVSYGRGLFTGENLFKIRYELSKKWTVETQTGAQASGVDVFYQIQFD
ncbi:MAG: translocation/assembly module TamB, partial [Deltaproteobacteria bacterium]|nr:translocation/assembly module TamB [Deltaproteobacteria bacterium]